MKQSLRTRMVHEGSKNASLQIQAANVDGEFSPEWVSIIAMRDLSPSAKTLRIDAVYHAISEGLEVQFAWRSGKEIQPIMPLAGRGRIDFSEVTGIHEFLDGAAEEIMIRVLGQAKNPSPCLLILMDFSKHQGAQ